MEYQFRLPPEWDYRRCDSGKNLQLFNLHGSGYQFFLRDNPQVHFYLSDTVLGVYADDPPRLIALVQKQITQYQLAIMARAKAENKALIASSYKAPGSKPIIKKPELPVKLSRPSSSPLYENDPPWLADYIDSYNDEHTLGWVHPSYGKAMKKLRKFF